MDARLKNGSVFINALVQAYQKDIMLQTNTVFPIDLEIDKADVTINEKIDDYEVGFNIFERPTKVTKTYVKLRNVDLLGSIAH